MDSDRRSTIDHIPVSIRLLLLMILRVSTGSTNGEGTPSGVGHIAVERVRGLNGREGAAMEDLCGRRC